MKASQRRATIDWSALATQATAVAAKGYAPYSKLLVGAAGRLADGRTVVGCNVENASYGLSLCAEAGMVAALHAGGAGPLVAVAVRSASGQRLMPCGRCRQLLYEAGGATLAIDGPNGPVLLAELLPFAFGPADLAHEVPAPPNVAS